MKANGAIIPSRGVAGQGLELAGCGHEVAVGLCGTVAASQAQGQTPGFQPLPHIHSFEQLLNLSFRLSVKCRVELHPWLM